MFRHFLRFLNPTAKVLDLGCGAGAYLKLVLEANPARQVTGVDLCPEMIKAAKAAVPTGAFHCRDIRTFDYVENAYDAVILALVINHLKEDEVKALAARVAHTVKPDGLLFMNFLSGEYSGFKHLEFADRPMLINYYDCLDIMCLMRSRHFASLRAKQFPYQMETSIGPEPVQDCYYFGHLLKTVDTSLRLKSAVAEPMIFYAGGKRTKPARTPARRPEQETEAETEMD
jgi:SAM-dependent methyltransferase